MLAQLSLLHYRFFGGTQGWNEDILNKGDILKVKSVSLHILCNSAKHMIIVLRIGRGGFFFQ